MLILVLMQVKSSGKMCRWVSLRSLFPHWVVRKVLNISLFFLFFFVDVCYFRGLINVRY